jgi:hypothetical protein
MPPIHRFAGPNRSSSTIAARSSKQFYIPLKPEVQNRKARFTALNEFVRSRNGWITSVPGDVEITIECLPGSALTANWSR